MDSGKYLTVAILYLITFRSTLGVFNSFLSYIPLGLILLISIVDFRKTFKSVEFNQNRLLVAHIFPVYVILISLVFLLTKTTQLEVLAIGVGNLVLTLIFWMGRMVVNDRHLAHFKESMDKQFLFLGIILSVGCIIQYYFSQNIYGLIHGSTFGEMELKQNVTKRGVSFITSPQAFGACMFIPIIILMQNLNKKADSRTILVGCLFLFVAFLTGTRVLLAMLIFHAVILMLFRKKYKIMFIGILCFLGLIIIQPLLSGNSTMNRIYDYAYSIDTIGSSERVGIWNYYLFSQTDLISKLFGEGPGTLSRGVELILNTSNYYSSTESYYLQNYLEIGLVGLSIYLVLIVISVRTLLLDKNTTETGIALITISFVNLTISPAYYGYTTSFYYNYILVYGIIKTCKIKQNEKIHLYSTNT